MNPIGPATSKRMTLLAAASSIGTTLEWYDFIVYNLMAALVFNKVFFPSFDPLSGTLLALSTYAVGYLSRPIGGLVFGHLGDRRHLSSSRRPACGWTDRWIMRDLSLARLAI